MVQNVGGKRLLDWRLPRQARRGRLDQRFQIAFVDNGDADECSVTIIGVSRLSRQLPDRDSN
jgi:hypothetical protein